MPDLYEQYTMVDDDFGVKSLDSSDNSPTESSHDDRPETDVDYTTQQETEVATDIDMFKTMMSSSVFEEEVEVASEFDFTWKISDWTALPKRALSDPFVHNGVRYRLLLFPQGKSQGEVSLFLEATPDVAEGDSVDPDWAACVQFSLVMWNPNAPQIFQNMVAHHRFDAEDGADWGFSRFYDLRRLAARHNETQHALLERNMMNITVVGRVFKDPTGVLWHSFSRYDSKRVTGYVGLRNQGATCYLNSLVQSLYFTNAFRKAVFGVPTGANDIASARVPHALQRLFYLLQTSNEPVSTLELTRAFGWDSADSFTQHDVQELERVLMDSLENSMKGTKVEGALTELFVGQMKSFIRCVDVDYESSRSEDFWDVQLNVKGMKGLETSLRNYIEVEMLDGENQYMAEGYGLQDAQKGVSFQSFPPVLHLQLKRYEYDYERDSMTKINERYEFPASVNLAPYLDRTADMSESWEYELHAVLVHSGDLMSGHYYGLLKPERDSPWFRFDDDRVTRATHREVFNDNFGGDGLDSKKPLSQRLQRVMKIKSHTSAYMLVYIRKSRLNQVLGKVHDEDVPAHIPQELGQEAAMEERRRQEMEEQHLYMPVSVASSSQFQNHHGFDTAIWSGSYMDDSDHSGVPGSVRALKSWTLSELLATVAQQLGLEDSTQIRLRGCVKRKNGTIRPDAIIVSQSPDETLEQIRDRVSTRTPELRVYVEQITSDTPAPTPTQSIVFLKHFDVESQSLVGVGHVLVDASDTVGSVVPFITQTMGWDASTPLSLFEEIKPRMIDAVKQDKTFEEAEIQNGDIITFQRTDVAPSRRVRCQDARQYYEFLNNRLRFSLVSRQDPENEEASISLWIGKKDSYEDLAEAVGNAVGHPGSHIRLYVPQNDSPPRSVKSTVGTVANLMTSNYIATHTPLLMYSVLDMPLAELETKRSVEVVFLRNGLGTDEKYKFLLPETGHVGDIVDSLKAQAKGLENVAPETFKLWYFSNGRNTQYFSLRESLKRFPDDTTLHVAIMSPEELAVVKHEEQVANFQPQVEEVAEDGTVVMAPTPEIPPCPYKWVHCIHFWKDPNRPHSIPFSFAAAQGELFPETKLRLKQVTGYSDQVFDKVKFAIVREGSYAEPHYVGDEDELYAMVGDNLLLGLDHVDKTPYKKGYGERSIVIK
ncbi:Ubiquitin carboxyl-terminal hydrolase 21 [Yarrowia sp. C11]|nr:Ubiquitin carboxyl-terminal hydrolase 21 [Yarrowia sp. E02]KAG5367427.1 Ubiquitin carboxyl-terminal hydrolase 21 [Yarrowia sp. C11]